MRELCERFSPWRKQARGLDFRWCEVQGAQISLRSECVWRGWRERPGHGADGSPGGRGHSGLALRAEVRKRESQSSAESLRARSFLREEKATRLEKESTPTPGGSYPPKGRARGACDVAGAVPISQGDRLRPPHRTDVAQKSAFPARLLSPDRCQLRRRSQPPATRTLVSCVDFTEDSTAQKQAGATSQNTTCSFPPGKSSTASGRRPALPWVEGPLQPPPGVPNCTSSLLRFL